MPYSKGLIDSKANRKSQRLTFFEIKMAENAPCVFTPFNKFTKIVERSTAV